MSALDPGALKQLQSTGSATWFLPNQLVDRIHPGLYTQTVQSVRARFIGTFPSEGVRGELDFSGISRVRMRKADLTDSDPSDVETDWVETSLATWPSSSDPSFDPAFDDFADYAVKMRIGPPLSLALSELSDSSGLMAGLPDGMLGALQNAGLEGTWGLRLSRTANSFAYSAIDDVELTFEILADFDAELSAAMQEAWVRQGVNGQLYDADLWVSAARIRSQCQRSPKPAPNR